MTPHSNRLLTAITALSFLFSASQAKSTAPSASPAASESVMGAASPKPRKQRPSTTEPVEFQNCKSYNYPGRHAAILQVKTELNPQIVFIGDSITHHWGGIPGDRLKGGETVLKECFASYRTLNLGFGHDRVQNALWRLQNGETDGISPDWVVINIGTNNLQDGNTAEEIMAGICAVCTEVHKRTPKSRIIVMSVFPRERKGTHARRKVIAELSKLIGTYATEQKFVNIDLAPQFLDANGDIPKELMPDALHLSPDGYRIWAKALLNVIQGKTSS